MWTEDGWIEERWFDIGQSQAFYDESEPVEDYEPRPVGFNAEI